MKHIFLYWPPWSWKSTVSKLLSKNLELTFFDTDQEFEKQYGRISEFVWTYGIWEFRKYESQILREIIQQTPNSIVSLGWGTLLVQENRKYAELQGRIILLNGNPATLYARIKNDTVNIRPLAASQDQAHILLVNRIEYYQSFEYSISIDNKNPQQITEEIIEILILTPSLVPRSPSGSARSPVDRSIW